MAPSLVLNLPLVCLAIVQASGFTAINSPPSPHSGRVGGCTQGVAVARLCDSLGDVNEAADDVPPLRILEFYSGIGGLRVSLEAAVKEARLGKRIETTAYEINAVANAVREVSLDAAATSVVVAEKLWVLLHSCGGSLV